LFTSKFVYSTIKTAEKGVFSGEKNQQWKLSFDVGSTPETKYGFKWHNKQKDNNNNYLLKDPKQNVYLKGKFLNLLDVREVDLDQFKKILLESNVLKTLHFNFSKAVSMNTKKFAHPIGNKIVVTDCFLSQHCDGTLHDFLVKLKQKEQNLERRKHTVRQILDVVRFQLTQIESVKVAFPKFLHLDINTQTVYFKCASHTPNNDSYHILVGDIDYVIPIRVTENSFTYQMTYPPPELLLVPAVIQETNVNSLLSWQIGILAAQCLQQITDDLRLSTQIGAILTQIKERTYVEKQLDTLNTIFRTDLQLGNYLHYDPSQRPSISVPLGEPQLDFTMEGIVDVDDYDMNEILKTTAPGAAGEGAAAAGEGAAAAAAAGEGAAAGKRAAGEWVKLEDIYKQLSNRLQSSSQQPKKRQKREGSQPTCPTQPSWKLHEDLDLVLPAPTNTELENTCNILTPPTNTYQEEYLYKVAKKVYPNLEPRKYIDDDLMNDYIVKINAWLGTETDWIVLEPHHQQNIYTSFTNPDNKNLTERFLTSFNTLLTENEYVLSPAFDGNNHWMLLLLHNASRTVRIFNSLGVVGNERVQKIWNLGLTQLEAKRREEGAAENQEWTWSTVPCTQQARREVNCGAWVLYNLTSLLCYYAKKQKPSMLTEAQLRPRLGAALVGNIDQYPWVSEPRASD